jgi:phosphoglucosamine mutase
MVEKREGGREGGAPSAPPVRRLFGTDGIRGVANVHPMTSEMAIQIGRAAAHLFKRKNAGPPRRHKILIGKDTRLSGYMIEDALASGICSMGVDVLQVGPMPTPGIAFLTESMRADAGVVISASHNPFQDNGIKFFSEDGFKLPDELELEMERMIFSDELDALRPTALEIGKAFKIEDARGRYIVFLKNTFPKDLTLDGLKIALDCANGAAFRVAPAVLEELGAEVIAIGITPDGENINRDCGSLHAEVVAAAVKEHRAELGIALDGDADRAMFVDEDGRLVDGDAIMAMCGLEMLQAGTLAKGTLVATVMSNLGLERVIREAGGRLVRTRVGDRYVVEEMLRGGYNLGGEQSGHLIFLDHNTTGDGMITALQVLAIMRRRGKRLSELASVLERVPQVLVNVRVQEHRDLDEVPDVALAIRRIESDLGSQGRVLVRYSGTEALVRVMIEGPDELGIRRLAEELAGAIKAGLGDASTTGEGR